ncbi:MAG: cysteine dioxygenase family protein [Pyrinomonadaceae bacterium]|nr:cysteine dioxygenase family protein [Pyrinomonadaceae bacterium]MCX7640429.1 cysteine dioxygenase family protein [Pyrinomonadaceae bacterium]MDW8304856.1 cysteine dioxygenase family protein [Acidobacteriota bacterium]
MISVENLVKGLIEIPDEEFTLENVYEFLACNPVDVSSIEPYLFWSSKNYTRNLIYKDERFELMALCWEVGQVSRIHNHADQKCWMTVPIGKLYGQNFRIAEIDESRNYCKLEKTESFELSNWLAAKVELEEPIHQILNLPEYGSRAVSLHIYSKPFDKCLSYNTENNSFQEVKLFYTSIYGSLCDGVRL